jgi:beta-lactam-binding protein with PASTA domain
MGSFNAQAGQQMLGRRGGSPAPTGPLLPTQGTFRQRPWLPWWLIPVILLLALLLFLLFRSLPQEVLVPKIVGEASAFKAEEKLTKAELKLDPNQKEKTDDKVPAGTIIGQTPAEGSKAEKGQTVTALIAVGTGKVDVPNIVGLTAGDAEKALREKNLTLGQASPQPVDPDGKIVSQIPAAKEVVKAGIPVDIFYPDPADAENQKKNAEKKDKDKDKEGGAGGAGGAGGGAGEGAKDIVVPAIGKGDTLDAYAKKLGDLGIVPVVSKQFNDAKPGTPFGTEPPGGTKVANGAKVRVLVSVGQPQVVYTNGKDILRLNGATGAKLDPVATGPSVEIDPTWGADGEHVAYTDDGRVMLKDLTKKNSSPVPLTPAGDKFADLAWAPTADVNLIAMRSDTEDGDFDLCLANVKSDATDVSCLKEPSFTIIRALHWGKDGRSILGLGVKLPQGSGQFGIVRWRVKQDKPAFSPDTADWTKGRFLTDTDTPEKGVLDAEVSPDGKRLALISNQGTKAFQLWLADDPEDFAMSSAKRAPVRACKVSWRGDSKELLIVQGAADCGEDVAVVQRVAINDLRNPKELNVSGDDPSFQPLTIGG